MNDIARALGRALVSQFHPRMLWLAVWPFLVSLVVWGALGIGFHGVAVAWLVEVASASWLGSWVDGGLSWIGFTGGLAFVLSIVWYGVVFAALVFVGLLGVARVRMLFRVWR